ncbi:hypothetical protein BDV95DRAFT_572790 [Massariosphaeria phaeospora]|uniref:F-box domain-containing protein n=1 Tax=Massariosphaeria phaeospora TaxID=100035 RepID=A0A7C8M8M4_9PLEO|nr:hypothetical protein BDV95DRAFT_572790 [Massariosphaeria phaeospora]
MYIDDDDRDVIGRFPEESDWALSSSEDDSTPFSPSSPHTSVSDEMSASRLSLFSRDRPTPATSMEALALSQPASTTASPDAPPTFLTLPPEIRHQIYRYLPDLVRPTPLIYCLSTFANNLQHPLASVSPLVRAEALAIFYSYNTWVIKLEFRMMYEAFHAWIIRLGPGAASLRLVHISVRGSLFKPRTRHHPIVIFPVLAGHSANTGAQRAVEDYHPPDGDASFKIDLSEKYAGGKVELVRCDGSRENGEKGRVHLEKLVAGLWGKRRAGTLNGQDWVDAVDSFLAFTGWW